MHHNLLMFKGLHNDGICRYLVTPSLSLIFPAQKRLTNLMKLFIFAILKKNIKLPEGGNYGYVFSKSRRY